MSLAGCQRSRVLDPVRMQQPGPGAAREGPTGHGCRASSWKRPPVNGKAIYQATDPAEHGTHRRPWLRSREAKARRERDRTRCEERIRKVDRGVQG